MIKNFEPGTSPLNKRLEASVKVAGVGYPLGFIVEHIYIHEGWREGYYELFSKLDRLLPEEARDDITFEMIQHRFTSLPSASLKKTIQNQSSR